MPKDTTRMTARERTLRAQHAAGMRWSQPGATAEHGRTIRAAQLAKFADEIDPNHELDDDERLRLAERRRSAYFADLARRSLAARRKGGDAA